MYNSTEPPTEAGISTFLTYIDLVRVEHSLRDSEGVAGGAGQDRHGELHRQAGGRKSGTGKGGELIV